MGLVNGGIHCFLEIGGFAVHLAVHPVSHVFHHPHAFKVQVALAGAYDLEKFGHFVSVFDIDDVIVFPVGHTGVHAEEGHGFDDFFCKPQRLGHHFQVVVALGTAYGAAAQEGASQVSQAGRVMEEIVSSVSKVSDMIGEISASAMEQHDGISQVNQAVTNLDQMTQQNAALVEESTAAAVSLSDQAQRLSDMVAVFKVHTADKAPALTD